MAELYWGTTAAFVTHTKQNEIATRLTDAFIEHYGWSPPESEVRSWRNSLRALSNAIELGGLDDHGLLLEYRLPLTSRQRCGTATMRHENRACVPQCPMGVSCAGWRSSQSTPRIRSGAPGTKRQDVPLLVWDGTYEVDGCPCAVAANSAPVAGRAAVRTRWTCRPRCARRSGAEPGWPGPSRQLDGDHGAIIVELGVGVTFGSGRGRQIQLLVQASGPFGPQGPQMRLCADVTRAGVLVASQDRGDVGGGHVRRCFQRTTGTGPVGALPGSGAAHGAAGQLRRAGQRIVYSGGNVAGLVLHCCGAQLTLQAAAGPPCTWRSGGHGWQGQASAAATSPSCHRYPQA